jgi:hypothetical protein
MRYLGANISNAFSTTILAKERRWRNIGFPLSNNSKPPGNGFSILHFSETPHF